MSDNKVTEAGKTFAVWAALDQAKSWFRSGRDQLERFVIWLKTGERESTTERSYNDAFQRNLKWQCSRLEEAKRRGVNRRQFFLLFRDASNTHLLSKRHYLIIEAVDERFKKMHSS